MQMPKSIGHHLLGVVRVTCGSLEQWAVMFMLGKQCQGFKCESTCSLLPRFFPSIQKSMQQHVEWEDPVMSVKRWDLKCPLQQMGVAFKTKLTENQVSLSKSKSPIIKQIFVCNLS
jgi:hypothetical protein